MIAIKLEQFGDKLKKRRSEIIKTLDHVQNEMHTIDESKEWVDQAAYVSRVQLLEGLANWYRNERTRIDDALRRLADGTYGFCIACHEPIEFSRLEVAPEATFCAECQKCRELIDSEISAS
jgi:RNA polymerase-binding transcription factor DksA